MNKSRQVTYTFYAKATSDIRRKGVLAYSFTDHSCATAHDFHMYSPCISCLKEDNIELQMSGLIFVVINEVKVLLIFNYPNIF